jgi:HAD superfamily hydrolase (TIGR01490 family)
MNQKLAVFDLDGTLYDGQVWKALVGYLWQKQVNRGATAAYVARNMSRYLLYKAKLMPRDYVWDRFARELMNMLGGLGIEAIHPLADELYQSHIATQLDPRLLAEWESFGRQGYKRIILSGSPTLLVSAIGRALDASAVLGTEAEIHNGKLTGRVDGELVHGKAKMQRLVTYIAKEGWGVDWRNSHAFGDSYTDLMVLSLVGHPHAVRPDAKLHAHAQAHGWRVLTAVDS